MMNEKTRNQGMVTSNFNMWLGLACFAFKIKSLTKTKKKKNLIAFANIESLPCSYSLKQMVALFFFKLTNKSQETKNPEPDRMVQQVKEKIPPSLTIRV